MREKYEIRKEDSGMKPSLGNLPSWNLDVVFERLTLENWGFDSQQREAEVEFKRFVGLIADGVSPIAMVSPVIDEVWHQFMLFSKQYREFCFGTVGFFIDHLPHTPSTPLPPIAGENFFKAYEAKHGTVPEIWFLGMNQETKEYYDRREFKSLPPVLWSGWCENVEANFSVCDQTDN